jgi:hypothetical protein
MISVRDYFLVLLIAERAWCVASKTADSALLLHVGSVPTVYTQRTRTSVKKGTVIISCNFNLLCVAPLRPPHPIENL